MWYYKKKRIGIKNKYENYLVGNADRILINISPSNITEILFIEYVNSSVFIKVVLIPPIEIKKQQPALRDGIVWTFCKDVM